MVVYRRGVVAHQVTFIRKGFVKIHRSIVDWEWYGDPSTRSVFLHLLFTANWKPSRLKNLDIAPGQCVTSIPSLAKDLGLSEKNVRTALSHLKATGEVADQAAGWCRLVTIVKWEFYQNSLIEPAGEVAGEVAGDRQATGRQVAASEEGKKSIKEERKKGASAPIADRVDGFKAKCKEITEANPDRLAKPERAPFLAYWTEPDASGRMRFEAEKFFDYGRRMDTWMANANRRTSNGSFVTKPTSSYGREEAEAERLAIRLKRGKDPVWGGVDDQDKSRELLIYEGKIKP